eukprot:TRINITY_DN4486_c0_g1_i6.p1 TRINITY_DN4486_c0_g1~~TRINITY_DN4486_c0_g1_i6.p1  ORF type:complete len:102 (+),score=14.54 TRINITY_DN4486_c0_g1_i6:55-360(+)
MFAHKPLETLVREGRQDAWPRSSKAKEHSIHAARDRGVKQLGKFSIQTWAALTTSLNCSSDWYAAMASALAAPLENMLKRLLPTTGLKILAKELYTSMTWD